MSEVVRHRHRRGGGVPLVAAGDRVEQRRGVARIAPERPDLVQGAGEGHDPVPAHAPVGRLHPHDPAHRGRLADRPAGVGADRQGRLVRGHGRRRATGGPARDAVQVPRVGRRPERGVLRGGAHRELVHVGLAQDHGPGVPQALGDVGVERRAVPLQDPGAGRALAALDRHEVLERHRDAEQRVERVHGAVTLAPGVGQAGGGQARVGGVGLGQRPLVVDRQPRVEPMVRRAGAGEVRGRDLPRGDLAGPEEGGQLVRQQRGQVRRHRPLTRRPGSPGPRRSRRRARARWPGPPRPAATAAPRPRGGCSPAR